MPRYQIIEYRGVDIVGLAASGTSTIYATDIEDARLSAQCTNHPKGLWHIDNGIHMKGEVEDGNLSIVIPLEDPEVIDHDVRLAFLRGAFRKSRVFRAFCDFMTFSHNQEDVNTYNTLPPTLDYFYRKLLTEIEEKEAMPDNTEFQVTDPVTLKPPHSQIQHRIVGRIVYIDTDTDKNEYGILYYTRYFRKLQVTTCAKHELQGMAVENPPGCPSNNTAHAYIEDIIAKENDATV